MNTQRNIIKFIFPVIILLGGCFLCNIFLKKCVYKTPAKPGQKTIFTFLGAPGAGKGTLAAQCVSKLGFKTVSTGNLCRTEIASGSEKGKKLKEYIMKGLVPDNIIVDMLKAWLDKQKGNETIILDGYPRTQNQGKLLDDLMKKKFSEYRFRVIFLQAFDEKEVVKRLTSRIVCSNKKCQAVYNLATLKDKAKRICEKCGGKLIQRADDKEEVIKKRLNDFAKNNAEIVSFYNKIGVIVETLNASHITPKQVFENFKKIAS